MSNLIRQPSSSIGTRSISDACMPTESAFSNGYYLAYSQIMINSSNKNNQIKTIYLPTLKLKTGGI